MLQVVKHTTHAKVGLNKHGCRRVKTNGTGSASRDIRDAKQRERNNKPVVHHGTQRPENDNQRVEDKEKRGQRVQVRDGRERSCGDRITETSPPRVH